MAKKTTPPDDDRTPSEQPEEVDVNPIVIQSFDVRIQCLPNSPLVLGRKPEIQYMNDPRNDQQLYRAAAYLLEGEHGKGAVYGVPAMAFKKSVMSSIKFGNIRKSGYSREWWAGTLQITGTHGESTRLHYKKMEMRADEVFTADKPPKLVRCITAQFKEWSCLITVSFNKNLLTAEQAITQLNRAGFHVGIGRYRPQQAGSCGMFAARTAEAAAAA